MPKKHEFDILCKTQYTILATGLILHILILSDVTRMVFVCICLIWFCRKMFACFFLLVFSWYLWCSLLVTLFTKFTYIFFPTGLVYNIKRLGWYEGQLFVGGDFPCTVERPLLSMRSFFLCPIAQLSVSPAHRTQFSTYSGFWQSFFIVRGWWYDVPGLALFLY